MSIMPILRFSARYILLPLLLVVIGAALATYLLLEVGRDVNANMEWYGSPNGILEEDFVELGGHPQYVRISGGMAANQGYSHNQNNESQHALNYYS